MDQDPERGRAEWPAPALPWESRVSQRVSGPVFSSVKWAWARHRAVCWGRAGRRTAGLWTPGLAPVGVTEGSPGKTRTSVCRSGYSSPLAFLGWKEREGGRKGRYTEQGEAGDQEWGTWRDGWWRPNFTLTQRRQKARLKAARQQPTLAPPSTPGLPPGVTTPSFPDFFQASPQRSAAQRGPPRPLSKHTPSLGLCLCPGPDFFLFIIFIYFFCSCFSSAFSTCP